jgi:hypothetical protein
VFRVALRLLLAAALGAVPLLARADVYRWVDADGATHYATTRDAIPRQFRSSAEVIPQPHAVIANPSSAQPPSPPPTPPPPVEPPPPSASSPAPAPTPTSEPTPEVVEPQSSAPIAPAATPPVSEVAPSHSSVDPRSDEIAQLEGQIERDREALRQLISTPRWDSEELASDPRVREISERLPRLQAELAALRTEAEH